MSKSDHTFYDFHLHLKVVLTAGMAYKRDPNFDLQNRVLIFYQNMYIPFKSSANRTDALLIIVPPLDLRIKLLLSHLKEEFLNHIYMLKTVLKRKKIHSTDFYTALSHTD